MNAKPISGFILVLIMIAIIMCALTAINRRWRLKKKKKQHQRQQQQPEKHTGEAIQKSMGSEVSGEAFILIFCDETYERTVDVVMKSAWMMVGRGTLGLLFKALLPDGSLVALRQLNPNIITACKRGLELQERLRFVGSIRHEQLLSLRCCFSYAQHMYLVHDYMCLGSLADLLHGREGTHLTPMNWTIRAGIALCTAQGVAAIHNKKRTTISDDGHRGDHDVVCGVVKSSNVMVRRDFSARLSGYEMPHLTDSATIINRNAGYVAPELLNSSSQSPIFTHKSDVYSFGVVLLELLTGRRAAHLHQYVRLKIEAQNLEGVFDSRIAGVPSVLREMNVMMHIAQQCLAKEPEMRPTMAEVVVSIKAMRGSSDVLIPPPRPPPLPRPLALGARLLNTLPSSPRGHTF